MKLLKLPLQLVVVVGPLMSVLYYWLVSGWLGFGVATVALVIVLATMIMRNLPQLLTLGGVPTHEPESDSAIRHGYLHQRLRQALKGAPDGTYYGLEDPQDGSHTLQLSCKLYTGRGLVCSIIEQREDFVGVASTIGNNYRVITDEYDLVRGGSEINHRHYVQGRTSGQAHLTKIGDVLCTRVDSLPDELLATVEHALLHWPVIDQE